VAFLTTGQQTLFQIILNLRISLWYICSKLPSAA
jgi:hypothetical protein